MNNNKLKILFNNINNQYIFKIKSIYNSSILINNRVPKNYIYNNNFKLIMNSNNSSNDLKRKHDEFEYSDEDTIDEKDTNQEECCSSPNEDSKSILPSKKSKSDLSRNVITAATIKKEPPKKQTSITQFFTKLEPSTQTAKMTTSTSPTSTLSNKKSTSKSKTNGSNNIVESPFFKKIDNENVKLKQVGNSPFFKVKSNNSSGNEDQENQEDSDNDDYIDEIKPTKKTTPTKSKKKSVNLTENKFSTLNLSDEHYKQDPQFKSSKKEKLENIKIGAHVSISCGYPKIIENAVKNGFKAIAFFTNPPRTWRPITVKDDDAIKFKESCQKFDFSPNYIMPHGSYFLNLGSPEADKLEKSRKLFIHEMNNCEKLGISLYNFHPGSHLNIISEQDSIKIIADSINIAHQQTKNVVAVIECTAGQGSNIGYKFEHLRDIIELVNDKSRVGVCLDTCHMFAAGYNLKTLSNCNVIFQEFDRVVGFKYLKGIHLNDSKSECGTKKDRHENIDKGFIGSNCFKYLVNDKRFQNLPMILETEGSHVAEVKQLYNYILDDKDSDGDNNSSSNNK